MRDSLQPVFHLIGRTLCTATISGLALLGSIAGTSAQTIDVSINEPSIDRNGYPFTPFGGGRRETAFIFGAIGEAGFDDRDAQFFNRFTTSSIVPAGLGSSNYQIVSATFTLSIFTGDGFVFDGTYDPISTYDAEGNPINDDDPGRPIELYGAGFRNLTTKANLQEETPFTTVQDGPRDVYATDFLSGASLDGMLRDVSNNVADAFDPNFFAIGQIAPGDLGPNGRPFIDPLDPQDVEVVFTLNLSNPDVLRYLQLSLDAGSIDFVVTSLHLAEQGGSITYPDFYTKENLVDDLPGRLSMEVILVPEASTITNLLCAFGLFVGCWRGRQALQPGQSNP